MKRLNVIGLDRLVYIDRRHGTRVFKPQVGLFQCNVRPVEWTLVDEVVNFNPINFTPAPQELEGQAPEGGCRREFEGQKLSGSVGRVTTRYICLTKSSQDCHL